MRDLVQKMKIIQGFEKVQKREILDCRIKSLKEMIHYSGWDISSFELLILCEAITYRYGYINYKQSHISGVPYVTSTNMDVHRCLLEKLGIHYECKEINSNEEGWEQIKILLDGHIPVLVELDGSVFMKRRKDHKMDLHYISYVLVVGYDEETREIAIVLTQNSQTDTYITLKYEDFQDARVRECCPYKTTGMCYYIIDTANLGNVELKNLIGSSIKNISITMLEGEGMDDIYSDKIDITDFSVGLPAMKRFISDYKIKSLRLLSSKKISSLYQLELLILRNNIQYGTLTCYREEFAKGLHMIAEKYNMTECEEAAILFEKSCGYWKRLIWQIGTLAKNKNKISFVGMRKIAGISEKIYNLEKRAFSLIADIQ